MAKASSKKPEPEEQPRKGEVLFGAMTLYEFLKLVVPSYKSARLGGATQNNSPRPVFVSKEEFDRGPKPWQPGHR